MIINNGNTEMKKMNSAGYNNCPYADKNDNDRIVSSFLHFPAHCLPGWPISCP